MTPQQIFDFTARALAEQRGPSVVDGSCRYRGAGGRKCSIGQHIPDGKYRPEMELSIGGNFFDTYGRDLPRYMTAHRMLLQDLQRAHDTAVRADNYKGDLVWAADGTGHSIIDSLLAAANRNKLDSKILLELNWGFQHNVPGRRK